MFKVRTLLVSTGFAAALLGAPAIAFAAGEFHPAGGEKGVTEHPSHRVLNKQRADVVAERNAAQSGPQARLAPRGEGTASTLPAPKNGEGLSRTEVKQEAARAMKAGEIKTGNRS